MFLCASSHCFCLQCNHLLQNSSNGEMSILVLPLNIECLKQCNLKEEFFAWTTISYCTLDFPSMYHAVLSTCFFFWGGGNFFISFIKCTCMTSFNFFEKYFVLIKVSMLYQRLQSIWIQLLLSNCVSLRFFNHLS